jgi:hypothetical protein
MVLGQDEIILGGDYMYYGYQGYYGYGYPPPTYGYGGYGYPGYGYPGYGGNNLDLLSLFALLVLL